MTTILNSTAVDFHSSKIIKLVFIEKQDAKAYVQYDNIILILKNHQLVNICSVGSLMHQKHTSTSRNAILLGRKRKKRLEEFNFICDDWFFKKRFETNMGNCSVPVVGVWVTDFSAYYVCRTLECFLGRCAKNTLWSNWLPLKSYPTEIKAPEYKDICTKIFIAVVSIRIILTGSDTAISNLATDLCITVFMKENIFSYVLFFFFSGEIHITK